MVPAFARSVASRFRLRRAASADRSARQAYHLRWPRVPDQGGGFALFREDRAARGAAHAVYLWLGARVARSPGLVGAARGAPAHRLVRRPHRVPSGNGAAHSGARRAMGTKRRQLRVHVSSSRRQVVERRSDYGAGLRVFAAARTRAGVRRANRISRVLHQRRAGL